MPRHADVSLLRRGWQAEGSVVISSTEECDRCRALVIIDNVHIQTTHLYGGELMFSFDAVVLYALVCCVFQVEGRPHPADPQDVRAGRR